MKRSEFIKTLGGISSGMLAVSLLGSCVRKDKEPLNIVFILADDLGWNQVGYHGTDYYETPNIDRIAREGIYFTDAHSASPVCSPTRASILTGKNPARLHITDFIPSNPFPFARLKVPQMELKLSLSEITIPELLKRKNYISGHFGKWHLNADKEYKPGRPGDPESQGFDEVLTTVKPEEDSPPYDAHHADKITKRAKEFIIKNKKRPFFCYISHHVVHRPLIETDELVNKYKSKPGANLPYHNPIMGAMIERMDNGIGEILNTIDTLNLKEKTIVIFYSDNGGLESLQKQDPLKGGKAMLYEGGIKVPLCIRWPGIIQPGSVSYVPVISDDFLPTLCEITGINNLPDDIDGISFLPLLKQEKNIPRNTLYWHYPHYHHQGYKPGGAIREGDFKLIEWYEETLLNQPDQIELYNVKKDPGETKNLSYEMPELAERLRKKFHAWKKKINAQEMSLNPNFDPEKADQKR